MEAHDTTHQTGDHLCQNSRLNFVYLSANIKVIISQNLMEEHIAMDVEGISTQDLALFEFDHSDMTTADVVTALSNSGLLPQSSSIIVQDLSVSTVDITEDDVKVCMASAFDAFDFDTLVAALSRYILYTS